MEKIEFITQLEEVKKRLPTGIVPIYLKAYPEENLWRLKNTISGKILDEQILKNLGEIAKALESINN